MEKDTDKSKENTSGEKEEETSEKKEPQAHNVSPDVLLTAIFTSKYLHSKRESFEYASSRITRKTKYALFIFNILALVMLILFSASYFKWNSQAMPTDVFMWSNLVFFFLIIALDAAFGFVFLAVFLKRKSMFSRKKVCREEIYLLKNLIAVNVISGPDKNLSKKQRVYNYSDIVYMNEGKYFIFLGMADRDEICFYKSAFSGRKRDTYSEVDSVRQKLLEETKKDIYIGSYIKSPRYQSAFQAQLNKSICGDLLLVFGLISFLLLLGGFLLNYRSGLTLDALYMFWLCLIISSSFLICGIFLIYRYRVKKRIFVSMTIFQACVSIICLFNGIFGNVYNIYNKFRNSALAFTEMTKIDLPYESYLNGSQTSSFSEVNYGEYRYSVSGFLTSEEQIAGFEQTLDTDSSVFRSAADESRSFDYMPSSIPSHDYYLIYSQTEDMLYPYDGVRLDSISDSSVFGVFYKKAYINGSADEEVKAVLTIVNYNIVEGGFIYPLLPDGDKA